MFQINVKNISGDKTMADLELVYKKGRSVKRESYTFKNLEGFNIRDIKEKIVIDMKSKGKIDKGLHELGDSKVKKYHIKREDK